MKLESGTAKPPVPLVTNVGIIDKTDISFGSLEVEDAFVTGAI
jgi:NRPS condensation-like uncharacterized protein